MNAVTRGIGDGNRLAVFHKKALFQRRVIAAIIMLGNFMTDSDAITRKHSRAPKQLGDFGEGLVTYALIRKGFEVACVDHVGADLIAEKNQHKIAVSVKTRMFRHGSIETRGIVIEFGHLEKLEHFAKRFDLDPVFAHAVCISDDHAIHLFMLRVADIREKLKVVKHGYRFNFGLNHLPDSIALPYVDYSSWSSERIATGLFENRTA